MSLKTLMASAAVALALPVAANAAMFENCTGFSLSSSGDGSVVASADGAFDCAFTLTGVNDGNAGLTQYTAVADMGYLVDFQWAYSSDDIDDSSFDPAGFTINGVLTQLTVTEEPPAIQDGAGAFQILAGDTFGWYVDSTDGILGAADLDVFSDFTVIPLPAGGLLLLTALGGMAALRRRRKAA